MTPDDTQDNMSEPGNPDINLEASGLPGTRSHSPPSRGSDWFDVDGIYERSTTPPNAERKLLATRLERIVLRLQDSPQYLERVEVLLGLNWDDQGI